MKIKYGKKFLKELADIPSAHRIPIEKFVFEILPQLNSIYESNKIESLKGYKNYYKSRFGNYRVVLMYEEELRTVERVLHRKEFYRYFPS